MSKYLILLLAAGATDLAAQHVFQPAGRFDPAVATPPSVLGYQVGERFTPHHLLMRYLERVAATSKRVRLDTVAVTFEGREVMLAIVTSERNQARLDEIRRDAAAVADGQADAAARLPAIVWLGHTVHGNEASGVEAAIALLYQLAAGLDDTTTMVLDSAVVLIDPVQNPDGHERHVQDVARRRGGFGPPSHPQAMIQSGAWPGARTSHYHFDLNRDWFLRSHPETGGRVATFLRWWPHVAVDLHEQGPEASYFFAPPMEPINKNVDGTILKWWDIFAASNAAAFDARSWPYFRREGYDEFYPGYGVSWPSLTGAVGMTYEQASSGGGAILRRDGTTLTLQEAARYHYTAAWATVVTSATRARERVRDYLGFRRSAVTEGSRLATRAILFERDSEGRADTLVQRLAGNGIVVHRLGQDQTISATGYGEAAGKPTRFAAGSYLVDLAQPQGRLAKALLEPDAELDSTFVRQELESRRTGQANRFYDLTAWSLTYTHRVRAWTAAAVPGGLEPVRWITSRTSSIVPARSSYAFEPGSEASLSMLAALLADGVRVWYAPKAFTIGSANFPKGAFLIRVGPNGQAVHEQVSRAATASGARVIPLATSAVDAGTDLGSNSVFYLKPPRVALLGGAPVGGNSFGFAWFALDQRIRYPTTAIDVAAVTAGALEQFDVLVVPSVPAGAFDRALGDAGRDRLASWVRGGGTLVTLEGATGWLAGERLGLARIRVRQDTTRADSAGGAPLPSGIPGAIVRATVDTLSPLLAGIREAEIPVLANGSLILTVPRNLAAGEAVVRHAAAGRLRLAGYLWPEIPSRLAESPYLWTEAVGRGRVIGFVGDPNFRDLWRGLLPLFGNAVLIGPSVR
ncbi:MAG: M14 family zinc carboxypeptidase [Gemmatimonadales bacterium]